MTVKVLIVDDSALMQSLLRSMLSQAPGLTVVGVAKDAYEARAMIKELAPDVLTLDVEMPGMSGLTFLKNLMRLRPMPVVMVSSHTQQGADVTFEALALGAVDYVTKPAADESLRECTAELVRKVKAAARVGRATLERLVRPQARPPVAITPAPSKPSLRVIGVGASTGGPTALGNLLSQLPRHAPPLLLVQHLPSAFSEAFVRRLAAATELQVLLATSGMAVAAGKVYVAPGNRHLTVHQGTRELICRLDDGEKHNGHRPSVDRLFDSLARAVGERAVGVLLTGMGDDGVAGLQAIRARGGTALVQDEETSVIWGMPGEAVARGAADLVLPLEKLGAALLR